MTNLKNVNFLYTQLLIIFTWKITLKVITLRTYFSLYFSTTNKESWSEEKNRLIKKSHVIPPDSQLLVPFSYTHTRLWICFYVYRSTQTWKHPKIVNFCWSPKPPHGLFSLQPFHLMSCSHLCQHPPCKVAILPTQHWHGLSFGPVLAVHSLDMALIFAIIFVRVLLSTAATRAGYDGDREQQLPSGSFEDIH